MLAVRELDVQYGRVPAVQEVDLDVLEGEIVGLVGPNGAGKSSTLAAITGLVPAAAGEITFLGESLVGLPPERIARRGIALLQEGRRIFTTLTVGENLLLGGTANRSRSDAELERVLDRFPILRKTYRSPAGALSGGEQQQLAIARALLGGPRLLLVDEPTLGLAPLMVDVLFDTLAEIRQDGVTLLLVEQNLTRTLELADRTYVLRSGRIALSGSRAELAELGRLDQAYLGFQTT
jgi:branched-chain amino acid transport system ATP-binding protein